MSDEVNIKSRHNQTFVRLSLQSKPPSLFLHSNRITFSHASASKSVDNFQVYIDVFGYWISTQLCPDAIVIWLDLCFQCRYPFQQKLLCRPKIYCFVGKLCRMFRKISADLHATIITRDWKGNFQIPTMLQCRFYYSESLKNSSSFA